MNTFSEIENKYLASIFYLAYVENDPLLMSVLRIKDDGYGGSWEKYLIQLHVTGQTVDEFLARTEFTDLEKKIARIIRVERTLGVNLSTLRKDFIDQLINGLLK